MRQVLINTTFLGWAAFILVAFRVLGPRRAGLVAVLGGCLFLPPGQVLPRIHPAIPLVGTTVTGMALLIGMIVLGRSGRVATRLRGPDILLLIYVLSPLIGFALRGPSAFVDLVDTVIYRTFTWLVPYAFARLYLADRDGPRDVAWAVVASGLLYLPIVAFEAVVGPEHYLLGLLYYIPYQPGMVERMGGWRPEGFLNNGIYLASWMAITAVTACWLALARVRYPRGIPVWLPAVLLLGGAGLCRGMYGMLLLGSGLIVTVLTQFGRTRWAIMVLAFLAPAYMGLRLSGAWDGRSLVTAAGAVGRPGTVATRIDSEDNVLNGIRARNLIWGDGVNLWASDAKLPGFWPDGRWLFPLWLGGVVGLTLHVAAIHLVPIGVGLSLPRGRPTRAQASSPAWCLALLSTLHLMDGIHNGIDFVPSIVMAGVLVGLASESPFAAVDPWSRRLIRLAGVGFLLGLPELASWVARRFSSD